MPDPLKEAMVRRKRRRRPVDVGPVDMAADTGFVFSESMRQAREEGLFFSGLSATQRTRIAEIQGIAPGQPTGLRKFDVARSVRDPANALMFAAPLHPAGEQGFGTLDEAKALLDEHGLTTAEIPLTAELSPKLGNSVHMPSLIAEIEAIERQRQQSEAIDSGIDGWATGAVSLSGGLIGTMTDPGDLALAFVPFSRAHAATKMVNRAASMVERSAMRAVTRAEMAGIKSAAWEAAGDTAALMRENLLRRTAKRAAAGGIDGFGGAIVAEPAIYVNNVASGRQYTAEDSMMNLVFGTVLGAGLHAGWAGVVDAAKGRWRGAEIQPTVGHEAGLATLPAETLQEMYRAQLANALHGRELNADFIAGMMGVTPTGRAWGSVRAFADGQMEIRGNRFTSIDEIVDGIKDKTAQQIAMEYNLSLESATRIKAAETSPVARRRLAKEIADAQAEDMVVANELSRLRGGKSYESLSEFINRTGGDQDLEVAFKRAKDAGYEVDSPAALRDALDEASTSGLHRYKTKDAVAIQKDLDTYKQFMESMKAHDPVSLPDAEAYKQRIKRDVSRQNGDGIDHTALNEMDRLVEDAAERGDDLSMTQSQADEALETLEALGAMDDALRREIAGLESSAKERDAAWRGLVGCILGITS